MKAILLDLGNVIVPFDFSIVYKRLHDYCGLEPEVLRQQIHQTGLIPLFETGGIEPREFVRGLSDAVGLEIDYQQFCDIWNSIFSRETLIPDSLLKDLHVRHRLILVSNTNAIHFEMIRATYPIMKHFDGWILSYEVGAMKPALAIFEAAVRAAGCGPTECFFADDIEAYVAAAGAMGIKASVFHGYERLQNDLLRAGIRW